MMGKEEGLFLAHSLREISVIMAGEAWWLEWEVVGHLVCTHSQEDESVQEVGLWTH